MTINAEYGYQDHCHAVCFDAILAHPATTVKNHLRRLYRRLGVESLVQAMNAVGWVRHDQDYWARWAMATRSRRTAGM